MTPSRLAALWEARLRAEGLAHLDGPQSQTHRKGRGDRGAVARAASSADIERRRELLASYPFRLRLEREAWRLHTEGVGVDPIAARLRIKPSRVASILAEVSDWRGSRWGRGVLCNVAKSDTMVLMRLVMAIS